MRSRLIIAVCVVVLLAGCSSLAGSDTSTPSVTDTESGVATGTPTATNTPTIDLPSGVDREEVTLESDLSESEREAFHNAMNSSEWVLMELSVTRDIDSVEYVYSNGSLWTLRVVTGTELYSLHEATESEWGDVENYSNLSDDQQEFFQTVLNNTPYALGPDESSVTLPDDVTYQNTTYSLSRGTKSYDDGALDVDRYNESE